MTPDKIFVRITEDDNFGTASIEPRPFTEAYIHKDTLLEWVRLAYGKLSMNPLDVQDVFEELIDKIK